MVFTNDYYLTKFVVNGTRISISIYCLIFWWMSVWWSSLVLWIHIFEDFTVRTYMWWSHGTFVVFVFDWNIPQYSHNEMQKSRNEDLIYILVKTIGLQRRSKCCGLYNTMLVSKTLICLPNAIKRKWSMAAIKGQRCELIESIH